MKILFLLFLAALLFGCAAQQQTAQEITFTIGFGNASQELKTFSGKNAFEALLENKVKMDYQNSPYGVFIKSIEGIEPAGDEYIAIYIDGKYSQKGIAEIYPENGMLIEFRLEKIDPSKF